MATLNLIEYLNGIELQGRGLPHGNIVPASNHHQIGLKNTISKVGDIEMANLDWRRKKAQSSHGPRIIGQNRSPHPMNMLQTT